MKLHPAVKPVAPKAGGRCSLTAPAPLISTAPSSLTSGAGPVAGAAAAATLARRTTGWLRSASAVSPTAPASSLEVPYGTYLASRGESSSPNTVSDTRCVWVTTVTAQVTSNRGPLGAPPVTYDSYTVVTDAASGLMISVGAPGVNIAQMGRER